MRLANKLDDRNTADVPRDILLKLRDFLKEKGFQTIGLTERLDEQSWIRP